MAAVTTSASLLNIVSRTAPVIQESAGIAERERRLADATLQFPGSRLQNHFLCLHHPLHLGGWDLLLTVFHSSQLFLTARKRAFHLLIDADNSHAYSRFEGSF